MFLKLAGPQLVQMFIGDGAKMVRDAFALAKEKAKGRKGAIIFIDEVSPRAVAPDFARTRLTAGAFRSWMPSGRSDSPATKMATGR